MLFSGQGRADSWQQVVTARVSSEYETNPTMAATSSGGVWKGTFEPAYTLAGRVGENEIRTGIAVQMARASNKAVSPDRDSPSVFLNWLHPSETGEFGITSRYAEVSTREAEGIDATGLVPASSTQVSRTLTGNWNKEISELNTVSLDGSYGSFSYKGSTYTNYSTQTVGLKFSHAWDEHTTPYIRVSGNKYVPDAGGLSTRRNDASAGLNWKAEHLDWTVQAGQSKVIGGKAVTQGSVETKYTGQLHLLGLIVSRQVVPSGLGGFVKTDQLSGNWSYALSEYSNTGLDFVWQNSYAGENHKTTSTVSGVWLEHNFNSLWKARAFCRYRTSNLAGSESVSSNILGLSFAYAYSDF